MQGFYNGRGKALELGTYSRRLKRSRDSQCGGLYVFRVGVAELVLA